MALAFSVTLNDASVTAGNPGRKSAEVAMILNALETVEKELQRGNGTVTSGTIIGVNAAGVANTSLGSWTYTPSATLP